MDCQIWVDLLSGLGILTISCNGVVLNRIETRIGVPISLSQVTRDYIGAVSNVASAVGSAITGVATANPLAVIGVVSGVGNAVEALQPRSNTIGTTGSYAGLNGDFKLDHQFFRPVNADNTHNGRPLCEVRKINTLSGFIIVQDGDVAINGTSTEDQQIRSYLESGFYYE